MLASRVRIRPTATGPAPPLIVDAASGVSGAGRAPKDYLHFGAVDEDFVAYGLLDHRHTAEMEQGLGAPVLFTPHLAPMVRGILATCYAPGGHAGAGGLTTDDAMGLLHDGLRRRAVRRGHRRPPVDQGHQRVELRPRHRSGSMPAPGWVVAMAAIDNLVKGASGQAVQCANLALGLPEDDRPARGRGVPMSITTPEGFVAAGLASGIKASGALDLALVATDDGAAVPTAATFTSNLAAAAAGPGQPGPPGGQRGPGRRRGREQRQRQRRHRRAGAGPTPSGCASWWRTGLGVPSRPGPGVLDRAHRHPAADGSDRRAGIPTLVAARSGSAGVGGGRRHRASSPPTPGRKEVLVEHPTFTRGRHGQGRGDAGAGHGHHAGLPDHRCRGRARVRWPTSCASPCATRSTR